jgi:hypothetical protein
MDRFITDVRYWTSVLGIEHQPPSPFDERIDKYAPSDLEEWH